MLKLLPRWVLQDTRPNFYDTESVTPIEMAGKLHAAMNELITEYNAFVDQWNEKITAFMTGSKDDLAIFESAMRQEFQDFIDVINLKIAELENGSIDTVARETKLDKYTNASGNDKAYGVDGVGRQTMLNVAVAGDIQGESIAMYNMDGCLASNDPTLDLEVANKRYVDNAVASAGGSSSGSGVTFETFEGSVNGGGEGEIILPASFNNAKVIFLEVNNYPSGYDGPYKLSNTTIFPDNLYSAAIYFGEVAMYAENTDGGRISIRSYTGGSSSEDDVLYCKFKAMM